MNKIIQESNLPQELKREIHKPNINKFIEKFKESPYFFENLRDFNFKDIYTFGKEAEELPRLNDEAISEILEYYQKIGEKNLDENLTKIKIFFQIKIGDLITKDCRSDYRIKHIKTAISKYGTKILNKLISESDLPKIYKNKINKPDYNLFTAKDSIKDNNKFLPKLLREIYTIGKNIEINPKENHDNFLNIFKYFKQVGINDLPEKIVFDEYCYLTKEQAALYETTLNTHMKNIGDATGINRRGLILKLITSLKQICNHPANYLKNQDFSYDLSGKTKKIFAITELILEANENERS